MKTDKLSIDVDVNDKAFISKLRAISEHAAALANELERIDKDVCPVCGGATEKEIFYKDNDVYCEFVYCVECGNRMRVKERNQNA